MTDGGGSARPRIGRPAALVLGAAMIVLGVPMLVCPGPGIATMLAGAGFVIYAFTGKGAPPRGSHPPGGSPR